MAVKGDPNLQGTGRHLSALELRAWTRFLDASRLLEARLARHLIDDHSMSHSEYEIIVRLDGAGGAMRLTVLADQCVSSKSRLTHTLDRLEQRGWITREQAPEDRRGIYAVLTETGSAALAAASGEHADIVRQFLLEPLSELELAVLADAMDRISSGMRSAERTEPDDEVPCD